MSDTIMDTNNSATDATENSESQAPATKTYTQEEFDRHMAGLKASLAKKYEKTFAELGDIEELRQLKAQSESKKLEEAKKRGEFEKVLQDLAAKKDSEIQKRDAKIREYQINMPLLSAAAEFRAVNAEQVKALLLNSVRLNEEGEVEVVDAKGAVRYNDSGSPIGVKDLVKEFLTANPHFVTAGLATTNTRSNVDGTVNGVDLTKLDMKNPEHRKLFAEMQKK
jgi:hypothetical protein